MIKQPKIIAYPTLQSAEPLTIVQLSLVADEIAEDMRQYRPEFGNLLRLHRRSGCRVKELFQPTRWQVETTSQVKITPQKGNAARHVRLADIGFADAAAFTVVLADMARLPLRQYERAFSEVVKQKGLYRLYENGFATPSTHFFRHVKIKELAANGLTHEQISLWIGEKNVQNLDYYLNSLYFL